LSVDCSDNNCYDNAQAMAALQVARSIGTFGRVLHAGVASQPVATSHDAVFSGGSSSSSSTEDVKERI
jgi:hypothetical protein